MIRILLLETTDLYQMEASGKNSTTVSGPDGSFNFTMTRGEPATIYIPSYNGYSWNSVVSTVNTIASQSRRLLSDYGDQMPTLVMQSDEIGSDKNNVNDVDAKTATDAMAMNGDMSDTASTSRRLQTLTTGRK